MNQDQDRQNVGPDLGSNYLQRLSAEKKAVASKEREKELNSIFQDMTFFDDPKNRVGILTTRLSTDASLVQGVSGTIFYQNCINLCHAEYFDLLYTCNEIHLPTGKYNILYQATKDIFFRITILHILPISSH